MNENKPTYNDILESLKKKSTEGNNIKTDDTCIYSQQLNIIFAIIILINVHLSVFGVITYIVGV